MAGFKFGGLVEQVATIVTSGSLDTLLNSSVQIRTYTGSTAQSVKLPVATTMSVGQKFEIYNTSSQSLTLEYQDATTFKTVTSGNFLIVKLVDNSTANGVWTAVAYAINPIPARSIPALDIDWSLANIHTKSISTTPVTITFSNSVDGQIIQVAITATVSVVGISWPAGVKWTGGSSPTQTGNKTDVYRFINIGGTIYGSAIQNY